MEAVAECHTNGQFFWSKKILRRGFRPAQMNEFWSTQRSEEMNRLIKDTDLVTSMSVKTLNWAGHVVGMLDNRKSKQTLERIFGRREPAGKPRNRWDDEVRKVSAKLVNTRSGAQR